jgi:AraC-like DNA-binding protein
LGVVIRNNRYASTELIRYTPGMSERDAGSGRVTGQGGWIRVAPDEPGCERIEAFFAGRAYEPHRHDTYAIGITMWGVQSFNYRGERRNSLAGETMVLHPDEVHDGQAGTEGGFRYRMLYIEPALIQRALGGRALPYVPDGVSRDPRLRHASAALLNGLDRQLNDLEYDDAVFDLAQAVAAASDDPSRPAAGSHDYRAAEEARAHLDASIDAAVSLADLEAASGRDRWALSRDFRALYGTSPHRYLVMRRLQRVKVSLRAGTGLAEAAVEAGFADQSHMGRHFRRAYGVTPAAWLKLLAA